MVNVLLRVDPLGPLCSLQLIVFSWQYSASNKYTYFLFFQACDWKNFLKLTVKLKKAYVSGIGQIKLAYIVGGTGTGFLFCVVSGIFVTFSITLLVCKSNFSHSHIQKLAMHTLSVFHNVLILIFFRFRHTHTHWSNNTQYWQKND